MFRTSTCARAGTELDREQVEAGFTLLLEGVEDNVADVPLYVSMLAAFVARAVSDEALAPSFLQRVNLSVSDLGNEVIMAAQSLLSSGSRNPSRLMRIWGYVANKYVWFLGVARVGSWCLQLPVLVECRGVSVWCVCVYRKC